MEEGQKHITVVRGVTMASTEGARAKIATERYVIVGSVHCFFLFKCLLESSYRNFYKQRLADDLRRLG